MDVDEAKECLNNFTEENLSRTGEAIDVLHKEYGSYESISKEVPVSPKVLSKRHHIFLLPEGIFWKVSEGKIKINQAYQISRLNEKNDQWLLAFITIEEELSAKECKQVVDVVLKQNRELKEVLSTLFGIRFDKIQPLLLPLPFDVRFAIARAAWNKRQEWEDLCFGLIRRGTDVEFQKIVGKLHNLIVEQERNLKTMVSLTKELTAK